MNNSAASGVKARPVVTGYLETLALTLVDKDTEIIDDYKNYYSVYTFHTETGATVIHKVRNEKLDLELNKKTVFTFLDGVIVAYKQNKKGNSVKIVDDFKNTQPKPNIFTSFIALATLSIPFLNVLMYLIYPLMHKFERDNYSLVDGEIVNMKYQSDMVTQSLISAAFALVGSGLIAYDYPTIGVLLNLAVLMPFLYTSNRNERKIIDGKHQLISKIKSDLENFKL